jgi:uncharacterized protein (DUF1810 family)
MNDAYDFERFYQAQNRDYQIALAEIRNGRKQSHWIWHIFPQLKELGRSSMAKHYGIDGIGEAIAYLSEPELCSRLIEISQALLSLDEFKPEMALGYTDAMKVRSCMTLFLQVEPHNDVFQSVIDKFYGGGLDERTLSMGCN